MKLAPGAAAVAMLMGCSTTLADAGSTLENTSWQLTEIQSMDDTQGTTPVPDAQRYTVTFDGGAEGETRASFQIDCNRGSGSWLATPSQSGGSGQLTFGPIAITQMACPPGSLDQRVSTALAGVRTYLIEDGRLHLSLLADSGILTWQPIG
ncbi:MAG: META domain-containing protein [Mycobacterium sp.]